MTNLDRQLFQELTDLLTPYMVDENNRRAWLQIAVGHTPVYGQLRFAGPAHTFTVQMIETLLNYGEISPGVEAIWALLEVVKSQVGSNKQQTIEGIQSKLRAFAQTGKVDSTKPADKPQPAAGGIHFAGDSTEIDGDVIAGGVVNKTIFQGPVTGPIHTGSGHVHTLQPQTSGFQEFTNIWYTPKKFNFFQWRDPDLGVLAIQESQITYAGEKQQVTIAALQTVTHTRMPGELNNNWVQVDYTVDGTLATAYFACASKLGIAFLVGGSEVLYHALRALVRSTKSS